MVKKGPTFMKAGCKVKICGTTSLAEAILAVDAGADYIGVVVEVGFSPRSLTIEEAGEIFSSAPLPSIALVFEMPEERLHILIKTLNPFAVQFLSQEPLMLIKNLKQTFPMLEIWQSIHLPADGMKADIQKIKNIVKNYIIAGVDVLLLDTVATIQGIQKFGGTGITSDWNLVKEIIQEVNIPVYLAGGINPQNVSAAIEEISPYGIDLCSGVEAVPGKKDVTKLKALMLAVRKKP